MRVIFFKKFKHRKAGYTCHSTNKPCPQKGHGFWLPHMDAFLRTPQQVLKFKACLEKLAVGEKKSKELPYQQRMHIGTLDTAIPGDSFEDTLPVHRL